MIVVKNNSGIGNKLKNIASALRRADLENDVVAIDFPHDDIFSIKQFHDQPKQDKFDYSTWSTEILSHDYDQKFLKKNQNFIVVGNERQIWKLDNMIDFQFDNIQPYIIEDYLKYFNAIQFKENILEVVDKTSNYFDIENCVGVHIRSWTDDSSRNLLLHNINLFIDQMKLCDDDFFVCSDSEQCTNELKNIFGNRIISQKINNERHITRTDSIQARIGAFVDLLLLSKCKKIIGTYQSTFTEVAWWFGQCKREVIIPMPEYVKKLYGE